MKKQFQIKHKYTKDLLDLRKQEKIFFSLRDYEKAEEYRRKADKLEKQESSLFSN